MSADAGTIWPRILAGAVVAIGCGMVAYHMATTQTVLVHSYAHQNIHLVFALLLVLAPGLTSVASPAWRWSSGVLLVLGLAAAVYIGLNLERLQMIVGFPEGRDVLAGVVLIVVVIEATRRSWGLTLPVVALVFVAYFFLGHHLPGPLYHRQFDFDYVVSYLSIGLSGIYGTFLSISAYQIFLFVVFGSLFRVLGIDDFLNEAGKIVGRKARSGPAQTAVVSSSLVGMITGASIANVAITGAFTIPYMKRSGYSPELAGAVEATASTGGQLMPPVMGAAAFLMAFFIGVPYVQVMLAGIIPAALFYLGVMASVHFASVREGINAPTEKPDYWLILRRAPAFALPLAVIIILLLNHYSPDVAAFWAIVTAIVIAFARTDRPRIRDIVDCLADGAMIGAKIAVSLAVVGVIAQTLISTGLGSKIGGLVDLISGGHLIIALLITMVVAIILGCGVPPAAAYSLVAITAAPTLVRMGLPPMAAHFFVFYFAIISSVTPPVALAALAACGLSGGNYFVTGAKAFRLAFSGFIIPFFIVYNPVTRLEIERVDLALGAAVAMPISLVALSAALYGFIFRRLTPLERVAAMIAASAAFGFMVLRHFESVPLEFPLLGISVAAFVWLCMSQYRSNDTAIAFGDTR